MSENKSNYGSIMKATSIFGGVQVFTILITLIRSKAVALLIGTAGMGLNGLLLSGLNVIKTITSLGINESAVRDISKAHSSNDEVHIRTTFQVFKRLVWFTAILGILCTIVFSPLLSKFAFGNYSKMTSFIWLSVTFIFGALSGGIYTLLRGTRQIKYLAQANIYGGILGLLVALPLFYFYGIEGVVPAIIITAITNYLVSLYFKSKVALAPIEVSWKETLQLGKPIVQLGLSLTIVSILSSAITFIIAAFISKTGTLSDVGLYTAGNAIVEGYIGMVFTAMATDYYPRLSGVIGDEAQWKKLVIEQAELVLIILGIVLILLLATMPLLIRVLLSSEFMASQDFIQFAVLAIPLKGLVWVVGYIFLAKGNIKLFLSVDVIASIIVLIFNLLFYHYYGLSGLGMSMGISYVFSSIMMLTILYRKYGFKFNKHVFLLLIVSLVSLFSYLVVLKVVDSPFRFYLHAAITILTLVFFINEFNRRIKIKSIINKFTGK